MNENNNPDYIDYGGSYSVKEEDVKVKYNPPTKGISEIIEDTKKEKDKSSKKNKEE